MILSTTYSDKISKKISFPALFSPKMRRVPCCLESLGFTVPLRTLRTGSSQTSLLACCDLVDVWHNKHSVTTIAYARKYLQCTVQSQAFCACSFGFSYTSICHLEKSRAVKFRVPAWTSLIHCFEEL